MGDKKSFVLYNDYIKHVERLSDEEAGQLFKALFKYAESCEISKLSDRADMAFSFISEQMERDFEKWHKIREKRSEAGQKGGKQTQANQANASFAKQNQANQANASFAKQNQANQAVNDNVNVNGTVNVINNKYIDQKSPTKSAIESEFEQIWELYPKKEGKKKALSCYQRARKKGTSFETVMNGIKSYAEYVKANKTEMQYIKQGSTYFNGECWNDVLEVVQNNNQSYDIDSFDSLAVNLRGGK